MLTYLLSHTLSLLMPRTQPVKNQLLFAFLLAFLLLFIKIWIPDIGRNSPFLLFTTAIILTCWFVGFISGIALTILSSLLVSFILITPFGVLNDHMATSVEAGVFVGECFFLCFFVDFVKKTFDEVSLNQKIFEALLAVTSPFGVIIVDENGIIVGWNKGAQKIFGFAKEEILGKPLTRISDKKNWFHRSSELLYVRVKTRQIFSPLTHRRIFIKIITSVKKKSLLYLPENLSSPTTISPQISQEPSFT